MRKHKTAFDAELRFEKLKIRLNNRWHTLFVSARDTEAQIVDWEERAHRFMDALERVIEDA